MLNVKQFVPLYYLREQEVWHKHRSALGKRISRPVEIARYVEEMNDVITNLVGKMRITRHDDKIVPNLDDELFKWAMECT